MKKKLSFSVFLFSVLAFSGCRNNSQQQTPTSGSTELVADESFAPILEDELMVFRNSYPRADIRVSFKPENQLLADFLNDKVQIAIMARSLRPSEVRIFDQKNVKVRTNRIAIDGIALIVNRSFPDSTVTVAEIVDILKGKLSSRSLVFDNANSSTVRYLKELAGVPTLPPKGIYALKSNPEVIRYVHNNSGALGVIGVNWIKVPGPEIEPLMDGIKVLAVKNLPGKPGSDKFYKPSQDNLALKLYPLQRELYIINCQGGPGLGTGFASFLASERGQRIVLKSGLLPDSIPSREIFIRK